MIFFPKPPERPHQYLDILQDLVVAKVFFHCLLAQASEKGGQMHDLSLGLSRV